MKTKTIFVSLILSMGACDDGAIGSSDASPEGVDTQNMGSHDTSTKPNVATSTDTDTRSPLCVEYCETWDQINDAVDCQDPCHCESKCEDLWAVWLSCVLEAPLEQCRCTADGLDCEGSFKDDEGAALCIDEYIAVDECAGEENSGTITPGQDTVSEF